MKQNLERHERRHPVGILQKQKKIGYQLHQKQRKHSDRKVIQSHRRTGWGGRGGHGPPWGKSQQGKCLTRAIKVTLHHKGRTHDAVRLTFVSSKKGVVQRNLNYYSKVESN